MASKIILFSCLALLVATVTANDLAYGDNEGADLIYNIIHVKDPEPFKRDEEVVYVGVGNNGAIYAIRVKDLQGDGTSSIQSGGLGEDEVEIKLVGKRGRGYEFLVEVYAKYE